MYCFKGSLPTFDLMSYFLVSVVLNSQNYVSFNLTQFTLFVWELMDIECVIQRLNIFSSLNLFIWFSKCVPVSTINNND